MNNHYLFQDDETYTRKQTIEMLNCSRTAVLQLEQEGIIEPRIYMKGVRDVTHYTKASVDTLLKKRAEHITITNFEEKWGLHRSLIQKLASDNGITFFEDKSIYLNGVRLVTLKDADKLHQIIKKYVKKRELNLARKTDFLIGDYALYQAFSDLNNNLYRLVEKHDFHNDSREFGFYVDGEFIPLEFAIEKGFSPIYKLNKRAAINSNYVEIHLPIHDGITKLFIDQCYINVGYRNMFLTVMDNIVKIFIKEGTYALDDTACHSLTTDWLDRIKIIDGEIHFSQHEPIFEVTSDYRKHTYNLKKSVGKTITDLAAEWNISTGELIELALKKLKENERSE